MSISNNRPTVAPVPDDTVLGQICIVSIEATANPGTVKSFRGTIAAINRNVQTLDRRVPNAVGTLKPDRTVITQVDTEVQLTVDEFNQDFLDTFVNADFLEGNARLWIGDPSDIAGVSRIMSNNFNCLAYLSGNLQNQADQFTSGQVTLRVNGTFTLTKDADSTS